MRILSRICGVALLVGALAGLSASAARAEFGIQTWEAGTCNSDTPPAEECLYSSPPSQFYTQAAGHPPLGITAFEVNTTGVSKEEPDGNVKDVRVDVPP